MNRELLQTPRKPGRLALVPIAIASLAGLLSVPCGAWAAQATGGPQIAPRQPIVTLLAAHDVRRAPDGDSRPTAVVAATRPITGGDTVLPVLARTVDEDGRSWLRVRLPGRVLGVEAPPPIGWISASNTRPSSTAWHIVVELGARRVIVYRDGRRLRSFAGSVGKPSTPTPQGSYFVEENVQVPLDQFAAPFALALDARSAVLRQFMGGPGQIALHGVRNIGGTPGGADSHGCVRLSDRAITWLAWRIRPGVPVTILDDAAALFAPAPLDRPG